MNKIKELRKQSLEKYRYSDCDGDNNHGIRFNEEMFANLIIQECIKSVEALYILPKGYVVGNHGCDQWWEGYDARGSDSTDAIKKHFGIE